MAARGSSCCAADGTCAAPDPFAHVPRRATRPDGDEVPTASRSSKDAVLTGSADVAIPCEEGVTNNGTPASVASSWGMQGTPLPLDRGGCASPASLVPRSSVPLRFPATATASAWGAQRIQLPLGRDDDASALPSSAASPWGVQMTPSPLGWQMVAPAVASSASESGGVAPHDRHPVSPLLALAAKVAPEKSPPRLELGGAPPSEEEFGVECAVIARIALGDDADEGCLRGGDHASGGRGVLEEPADIDYESSGWGGASPEDFDFDFLLCDAATDDDELEGNDENDETDPDEDPALTDGEGSDEDGYKGDKDGGPSNAPRKHHAARTLSLSGPPAAGGKARGAAADKLSGGRKREASHAKQANSAHVDFGCGCALAEGRGQTSCLKQFSVEQLMGFHREAFGVYINREMTNPDVGPSAVSTRIHRQMWPLRENIRGDGAADAEGRSCTIRTWKLDGKPVCRDSWVRAYGATKWCVRTIYSVVQRGHAPEHKEAGQQATALVKLMARVVDAGGVHVSRKREWAANWWNDVLLLMDWLPDEQRIRIRGPGFDYLHRHVYTPVATAVGLCLGYKTWKQCMKQGIVDACRTLPGSNPKEVRCTRAANHSNFPECATCSSKRNRWLSAAKNPNSDPEKIKACFSLHEPMNGSATATHVTAAIAVERSRDDPAKPHDHLRRDLRRSLRS